MKNIIWIIVVLAVIVGIAWWSQTKNKAPITGEPIKVGVSESLSGVAAYYGEENKKGVDLAEIEVAKKYPHLKFQIFHEDNMFTSKGGVDSYFKLKNTYNIDTIITHTSPVAIAVQPLAKQDGILQMAVSASASGYSSPNDLSFRTTAGTDSEAGTMAKFIKEKGWKRVGILYMKNEIGTSLQQSLTKQLEPAVIAVNEGFLVEEKDFRTLISKLRSVNADAVYVAGTTAHLSVILKQSSENGLRTEFLGFRTVEDPSLIQNSGTLADGVIYTYGFDVRGEDSETVKFTEAYEEKFGTLPNGLAAEGYEGMMLVAAAFDECGKEYACIQEYLSGLRNYPSIFGNLSFDQNGDVTYPFFLKVVRDGKFVRYED